MATGLRAAALSLPAPTGLRAAAQAPGFLASFGTGVANEAERLIANPIRYATGQDIPPREPTYADSVQEKPFLERYTDPSYLGETAGRLATDIVPVVAGMGVGIPPWVTMGAQAGIPGYVEAKQAGATGAEAAKTGIKQAAIASVIGKVAPMVAGISPTGSATANFLAREAGQAGVNAGATALGNVSEGRPIAQGVPDAAVQGAALSLAMQGAGKVAGGLRAPAPETPAAPEAAMPQHAAMRPAEAPVAPTEATPAPPAVHDPGLDMTPAPGLVGTPPMVSARGKLRRGGPWSTPLLDRVERQGGTVGAEFATRGRLASDTAGSLRGRWQLATKPLKMSLRGINREQRAARNELNQRSEIVAQDPSGPLASYGTSKFQDAVENDTALAELSPKAQEAVQFFRQFIVQTGEDVARIRTPENAPILMQTDEGLVPFTGATGGKRLIRQWTPEMWEVMHAGEQSRAFRALAQALAEVNGLPEDVAMSALNGIRDQVVERRSAVEVARTFKQFPSFIRLRDGAEVPLLQTDPMHAASSIVDGLAKRIGYIQQFGQSAEGASLGERLRESFVRSGGEQVDVDNAMRALQGIPVDAPSATLRPGTKAYEAARVYDTASRVGNAALLTRSFVPNIFESVSKTPVVGGIRNSLRAYRDMGRMAVDPKFRTEMMRDIEQRGWHTVDMIDAMLTPGREMESGGRIIGQALTLPATKVNELNDVHAAITARGMLKTLEAGKGSAMDRQRLELLQFTPEQIGTIMAGNPTPETAPLFDAVGRRLVSYSQGSTSMPAEMSRLLSSRDYARVIAFDRYAQFTANRFVRQVQAIAEAPPGSKVQARQAALLVQSVAGHSLAGAGAVLFGSLLKDGVIGLKDTIRDATRGDTAAETAASFATFMMDAAQYAMLGGAADTLRRAAGAGSSTDAAKTVASGTIPGRYTVSFIDWWNGAGVYKNLTAGDAAIKFIQSNLPIAPVIAQVAAEVGLGHKDIRREVAIKRAWQFIRENEGVGSSGNPTKPLDREGIAKSRAFGAAMKRIENAIRTGDTESLPDLRSAAISAAATAGKGGHASLLGRRIIPNINVANRPLARKWMGEDNWKALEKYDALITAYAQTLPKGR